jgi:hypothetical protein
MHRATHRRIRLAFVAIVCLLFQQVAVAAYACPLPLAPAPVETPAMAGDCAGMSMPPAATPSPLCAKHCSPDVPAPADHAALSVPALALPAQSFEIVLATHSARVVPLDETGFARSDPPPRLRFCSLLI